MTIILILVKCCNSFLIIHLVIVIEIHFAVVVGTPVPGKYTRVCDNPVSKEIQTNLLTKVE